ncbi:MAG: response regulator [Granulosicoccus sp.]|nr:response regulator [Granulosicoccus sp.]
MTNSSFEHGDNGQTRQRHTSAPPISVLLVDDSHTNRRMARECLSKAGHRVMTAVDGFDALAKVVSYRPSIVFADSILPRLDGYQTCALIRNNEDFRNVKVVLLCGGPQPFDKARAKLVGIDSSLTKPLTEDAILNVVSEHAMSLASIDKP